MHEPSPAAVTPVESDDPAVHRRTVLRAGAIGGALLWTVPALQVVGVSAANADTPSVISPPPPPPPTSPPPGTGTLPSHGFVLVNCGKGVFAVKIDSGSPNKLQALGQGNDVPYLKNDHGWVLGDGYKAKTYRQATSSDLAHISGFGVTTYQNKNALFIALSGRCEFVKRLAFTWDGSFGDKCGDGDKVTNAFVKNNVAYFLATCNEPSTGE